MKFKNLIFISVVLTTILLSSCDTTIYEEIGNWERKAFFPKHTRSYGASFVIDNFGYYGLGTNDDEDYFTDFYKYDPVKDLWTQIADFPGIARAYGVSTSNDTHGFAGLGYDGNDELTDFWQYDPVSNTWTQLDDYPGGKRQDGMAFSLNNEVYVGLGRYDDNGYIYHADLYKWNGSNWSDPLPFGGQKRANTAVTTYEGKAYVIGGRRDNLVLNDFLRYDPATGEWLELMKTDEENYGNDILPRHSANTFIVDNKLYVVNGNTGNQSASSCFECDLAQIDKNPLIQQWIKKTSSTYSRMGAGTFILNNQGYVVAGSSSYLATYCYDDLRVFHPDVENYDEDDD